MSWLARVLLSWGGKLWAQRMHSTSYSESSHCSMWCKQWEDLTYPRQTLRYWAIPPVYPVEENAFYACVLYVYFHEWSLVSVKCFSSVHWDNGIPSSCCMIQHIHFFACGRQICRLRINPTWPWCGLISICWERGLLTFCWGIMCLCPCSLLDCSFSSL